MLPTIHLIFQIMIGAVTVVASIYGAVMLLLKWTKNALETDFISIKNQLDLLKQNIAYTNQLLLEKISRLEKEIEDIQDSLDKESTLSYVKRRKQ